MATYIGKRVVPIVRGNWDINQPYEMLSIVLDTATKHSYISRREVPAGVAITNTDYWTLYTISLETAAIAPEMAAEIQANLKAIRYDQQELEESEKVQARQNIQAAKVTIEGNQLVISNKTRR